jgi:hypothetical protein
MTEIIITARVLPVQIITLHSVHRETTEADLLLRDRDPSRAEQDPRADFHLRVAMHLRRRDAERADLITTGSAEITALVTETVDSAAETADAETADLAAEIRTAAKTSAEDRERPLSLRLRLVPRHRRAIQAPGRAL